MDNPYQAPETNPFKIDNAPAPAKALPTAVMVVAILGLIYGGFGLLCNPVIGLGNLNAVSGNLPEQEDVIMKLGMSPTYRGGLVLFSAIGFVTAAMLVAASAGLLMKKPWGRALGLVYSVMTLTALVANLIFAAITFLGPLISAANEAATPHEKGRLYGGTVGAVGVLLFCFVFPILVAVILNLKPVVDAYRPKPPADDLA